MSNLTELDSNTLDLISCLRFNPDENHLLSASWDGYINIYKVPSHSSLSSKPFIPLDTSLVARFNTGCPVLDCCWDPLEPNYIYTGNINGIVYWLDLSTAESHKDNLPSGKLGERAELGVCKVVFSQLYGVLITLSWDKTLRIIDPNNAHNCLTKKLPHKPFVAEICENFLIISMARNTVQIYDLSLQGVPLVQQKESGLRFQTTDIQLSASGHPPAALDNSHIFSENISQASPVYHPEMYYIQSSYESRIVIDYIDPSPSSQEKKFAFKCHKIAASDGVDMISPINSIVWFRDTQTAHGLLYTGGSDGIVNLWDLNKKKKVKKLKKFPMSVLKMAISTRKNGHILAIATGNDSYKNNRFIDNADKENAVPPSNISGFSSKLFLKAM